MQLDSWERVVDGELSRAELLELVKACQEQPGLWQRCAEAFLEEQALEIELRQLAAQWPTTPEDGSAQQQALSRFDDRVTRGSRACSASKANLAKVALPDEHSVARPYNHALAADLLGESYSAARAGWLNPLGLAACVVLAFLIGWQASERFGKEVPGSPSAEAQQGTATGNRSLAQQTAPKQTSPKQTSLEQPVVGHNSGLVDSQRGADRGDPQSSMDSTWEGMSPSVETTADAIREAWQRLEQFVPLDRRIPQQLADLERRGLVRIESIEGFVPVRLRDGNTAVVPVQQIELRPVRNAY